MRKRIIALRTFTTVDLAESESLTADFSVVGTGGYWKYGDLFLLEKWKKRGSDPVEVVQEYVRQMRKFCTYAGFIEKNRFESLMRTTRKLIPSGIFGDPDEVNKVINRTRMIGHYGKEKIERFRQNIVPVTRAKKLWIRSTDSDLRDLFIHYPAVEHDDLLDMLDMMIEHGSIPTKEFVDHVPESGRVWSSREPVQDVNEYFAKKKLNIYTGVAH